MRGKKYAGFEDASAIAEFCSLMNKAFDILNCRSKFPKKPFNQPINNDTIEEYTEFLSIFKKYISNLKDNSGKKIIHSTRNTRFIGIIHCLENSFELYRILYSKKH